jgi:hypothetical protein
MVCSNGFNTTIPKISNHDTAIVTNPKGVKSLSNWSKLFIYICYFLLKIDVTTLADNKVAEYISKESKASCGNNEQKMPIIALNNASKPATLLELTSLPPETISLKNFIIYLF